MTEDDEIKDEIKLEDDDNSNTNPGGGAMELETVGEKDDTVERQEATAINDDDDEQHERESNDDSNRIRRSSRERKPTEMHEPTMTGQQHPKKVTMVEHDKNTAKMFNVAREMQKLWNPVPRM